MNPRIIDKELVHNDKTYVIECSVFNYGEMIRYSYKLKSDPDKNYIVANITTASKLISLSEYYGSIQGMALEILKMCLTDILAENSITDEWNVEILAHGFTQRSRNTPIGDLIVKTWIHAVDHNIPDIFMSYKEIVNYILYGNDQNNKRWLELAWYYHQRFCVKIVEFNTKYGIVLIGNFLQFVKCANSSMEEYKTRYELNNNVNNERKNEIMDILTKDGTIYRNITDFYLPTETVPIIYNNSQYFMKKDFIVGVVPSKSTIKYELFNSNNKSIGSISVRVNQHIHSVEITNYTNDEVKQFIFDNIVSDLLRYIINNDNEWTFKVGESNIDSTFHKRSFGLRKRRRSRKSRNKKKIKSKRKRTSRRRSRYYNISFA